MRDYGAVSPQFWIGKTGKALRGNPHAQLLALYLMTCPHASMIGVFHCPVIYMAHETGIPFEGASKGLQSLIDAGFCQYDHDTEEVFILRMAAFQIGERLEAKDNRCKSTAREYEKVQSALIKAAFYAIYSVAFHLPKLDRNTSPFEAPSKPLRSQEQEQEQEQEHAQVSRSRSKGPEVPKPRARTVDNSTSESRMPSPADLAVQAMAKAGLPGVAAGHPDVLALLGKGVAPESFGVAAAKSVAKNKGFAYVVGVLTGQIADAAVIAAGPAVGQLAWDHDRPSIEAEGERLGLGRWCGSPAQELFSAYTARVRVARDPQHEKLGA